MSLGEPRDKNRLGATKTRLLFACLIACGLQVPLFWSFAEAATGQALHFECADLTGPRSAEISPRRKEALEARCGPGKETRIKGFLEPKPEPEVPENAQIVDVSHMPEVKNPTPVVTPHLSDKTTRTEKETRATAQKSEPVAEAEKAPETTPEKQREKKPKTQPKAEVGEAKKPELENFPKVSDAGSMRVEKPKAVVDGEPSAKSGLLSPARGPSSALKNYKALNPDGTSDHLPDIEEGDKTVLNANAYRFADYFLQMKRAVERQWRPGEVYLRRDPMGEVYGVKDRYTVLRVTLDAKGRVIELLTSRQSGLDFMDAEAKRAIREAGPYPNPPDGLADGDGMIRFEFGFFFEVSNGRGRFNWRRL